MYCEREEIILMINILFLAPDAMEVAKYMQPESVFYPVSAMLTMCDLYQATNMKDIDKYDATLKFGN